MSFCGSKICTDGWECYRCISIRSQIEEREREKEKRLAAERHQKHIDHQRRCEVNRGCIAVIDVGTEIRDNYLATQGIFGGHTDEGFRFDNMIAQEKEDLDVEFERNIVIF